MQIECQLINQVTGDVCLGKGGDVAKCLGRVIRHQRVHLDLVATDVERVCDTLRQVFEDLSRGVVSADNEWEVQSIIESHLD